MCAIAGSRRAVEEEKLQKAQRRGKIQGEEVGLKGGSMVVSCPSPRNPGSHPQVLFSHKHCSVAYLAFLTLSSLFWVA